ncbi:hypothetical protein [Streptosporangium sp. NPDC000396]|uniref:hypothetical protein n=1 Tax=Streptosporangium sp. NPDC000396 TaxID=3366185 RepID=UPI0036C1F059
MSANLFARGTLDKSAVLYKLLQTMFHAENNWRVRAVEMIELSSALWAEYDRRVHVAALNSFLGIEQYNKETEELILPVMGFPRAPRIDLRISVGEKPAYVVSREEHGNYMAGYIRYLASTEESLSALLKPDVVEFLAVLFNFHPWCWRQTIHAHKYTNESRWELVKSYLKNFDGIPHELVDQNFIRWCVEAKKIEAIVQATNGDKRLSWRESAAENPLLAVPWIASPVKVTTVLDDLSAFLKHASTCGPIGKEIVDFYAYYGRFWIALVESEVSLAKPFMIRVQEKRPLDFNCRAPSEGGVGHSVGGWKKRFDKVRGFKTVRQLVEFRDAQLNHLNIRIPDDHVEMKGNLKEPVADPGAGYERSPSDVIASKELYSYYSADPKRPERLWFTFPLTQSVPRRVTIGLISSALTFTAFGLLVITCDVSRHDLSGLALLLLPSSLAGSLLLVRLNSTLGSRVNSAWHAMVAVFLLAVWVWAGCLYITGKVVPGSGQGSQPSASPSAKVSSGRPYATPSIKVPPASP